MTTTAQSPQTFADAQALMAAQLPAYTRRPQQEALAAAIERILSSGEDGENAPRVLLAQAGTGIGKSLALLIPAIVSGKRTIIATSTKVLQEQYGRKDLPFLEKMLPGMFTWAVLKGRSNYACHAKIASMEFPGPSQQAVIDTLDADDEQVGDRENLPQVTDLEWSQLSMSAAECPGMKDCPFGEICRAERAKAKAAEASIVITNTAYLATDLIIRQTSADNVQLLGEWEALGIDEAHNLESAITGALSDSIGRPAISRTARDAEAYLMAEGLDPTGYDAEINDATTRLWTGLEETFSQHMRRSNGKADPMPLRQRHIDTLLLSGVTEIVELLRLLRDAVKSTRPEDDRGKVGRQRLMRRLGNWVERLQWYVLAPESEMARWLEQEEITVRGRRETRLSVRSAPISVGPFLRDMIWSTGKPVVLMSATLAVGSRKDPFGYIRRCTGLNREESTEFDAGSPFSYQEQALLYIPEKHIPQPSGATAGAWRSFAQEATEALVTAAKGGALLLFTSRTAMEGTYSRLAPRLQAAGMTVLKQGDTTNAVLGQRFRDEEDSVLFGLKSFFEGFDVQGRALRLVVLDKLPFAVPTDVLHAARCDAITARYGNGAWFSQLTIPEMSLALIQAFGRLIRHLDDRGVVAVLDSRLTAKSYGPRILESLPPAPQTTDIRRALAFWD
jgi:ATP-dependent DNA helicase DinG